MHQKINLELLNASFSDLVFIGDSEIVLTMNARNDPASLPIIYGTRIMEIRSQTTTDNWMWCPGPLNPANLLTRSGSTLKKINSNFWLFGSFLLNPVSTWPNKPCSSLISNLPFAVISRISAMPPNPLTEYISEQLEHVQSFTKVVNAHCILQKFGRKFKQSPTEVLPWARICSAIYTTVSCFSPSAESFIVKNKLKHLLIQPQDGIYYISDRSFRSHQGVPPVCGKSLLARCIVQAHRSS